MGKQFDEGAGHQFVESAAHQRQRLEGGNLSLLWTKQAEAKRWGLPFNYFAFIQSEFGIPPQVVTAMEPYRYDADGMERRFLSFSGTGTQGNGNYAVGDASINQYTGAASFPPWTIVVFNGPYPGPFRDDPSYTCTIDEIQPGPPGFYVRYTEASTGLTQTSEITAADEQYVWSLIADAKVIYNAAPALSTLGVSKCYVRDGTGTVVERFPYWAWDTSLSLSLLGQFPWPFPFLIGLPSQENMFSFDTGVFGRYGAGSEPDVFRVMGGRYLVNASDWHLDTIGFSLLNAVTSRVYTTLAPLTGAYDLEPAGLPPVLQDRMPRLGPTP